MRTACGPHCQRGGYGDFNPNDVVDLRLSFVSGARRVNARGERAWRQPGSTRQDVGGGGRVFRRRDGFFGGGVHLRDATAVGEDVHFGRGDSAADGGGASDFGTVRARKLSADSGVRGGARDGAAERGGEREPRRVLSGGDARGRWACVLARGWVLWALAGPIVGPGLLCGPDVVYDWDHRLGVPGLPGPVVDCP